MGKTTPYKKGRRIEYKCMQELRKQDYYPIRSAGSHSIVDIVAIDINIIRLIQVKSSASVNPYIRDENVKKLEALSTPSNCRKELWIWIQPSKKWKKSVL